MMLLDVNVLIYAHRQDAPNHDAIRGWLEDLINSDQAFGMADFVLSGFLRVVTHPKVFNPPSSLGQALAFARELRDQPNCIKLAPGSRHWDIFCRLCQEAGVKGNLVPDAFLAALAIESGSEWITTDRGTSMAPSAALIHISNASLLPLCPGHRLSRRRETTRSER